MNKKRFAIVDMMLCVTVTVLLTIIPVHRLNSNKYLKATLPTPTQQWQDLHGDSIKSRQAFAISYFVSKENANDQPTPNP